MGDYSTSRIDDLPQLWDGFGKLVRKGLGIEAFGANIMDLPADYTTRSHDESGSGQEELYIALRGAGWVLIGPEGEPLLSAEWRRDDLPVGATLLVPLPDPPGAPVA